MDDIFSNFGDIFGDDLFGNIFGGGRRSGGSGGRARGIRGSNLRVKLKLNFEEIYKGIQKTIKVKKYVTCNTCGGNGAKVSASKPVLPAAAMARYAVLPILLWGKCKR